MLWILQEKDFNVVLMWVPSHVGIEGNETVDMIAKNSSRNGDFWNQNIYRNDFYPLAKIHLFEEWQKRWNIDEMGRFAFSINPNISLSPWFQDLVDENRRSIVIMSRIISNHTRTASHLNRIKILADPLCICGENYETVDHILWQCPRFTIERETVKRELEPQNFSTAIRDLL
jgi:hypothetical protein